MQWQATLLNGSNYIRQQIVIQPLQGNADIAEIHLVNQELPQAAVCGTVDGSPIVAGNVFVGFEHPMSKSTVQKSKAGETTAVCYLSRRCRWPWAKPSLVPRSSA